MQLGVLVEAEVDLTWDRWRCVMARVEALGYDSLWLSDHCLSLQVPDRQALETWVALTLVAAETTRLRFGPLVSPITFRHPSLLARMAASLDALSGGRLVLGVGAGWNEVEHYAYGIPFPPARVRMDMLEEGIEVILRLLGDGPAHYAGRYYQLDGADPRPKSTQRPRIPLLVGGMGKRRTLPLVARYADEWNLTTNSAERYGMLSARLAECCRAIGRDPATIRRSVAVGFLVGMDAADLRRRCAAIQRLVPRLASLDVADVPDALRAVGWVVGTPAELLTVLRDLSRAGVQRAMLQLNDLTDLEALDLVAREVMPALAS
jgi:F420-dependent oxidoreductase-like protein